MILPGCVWLGWNWPVRVAGKTRRSEKAQQQTTMEFEH